jgi:protocatechuate 3,4-dioxygenase beta subunit
MQISSMSPTRRSLLRAALALPGGLFLTTDIAADPLQPTPECADADDPTPPAIEGPFFKPQSPRRASLLEPGLRGRSLVLSGRVLSTDCRPIPGALIDFWHADDGGEYDNAGFRLRGHQFAAPDGGFRLETIVPGEYTGRTRHIHVKVQAPGLPRILTTQLFFPDEPRNRRDRIFRRDLLMDAASAGDAMTGRFDFVLVARGRAVQGG